LFSLGDRQSYFSLFRFRDFFSGVKKGFKLFQLFSERIYGCTHSLIFVLYLLFRLFARHSSQSLKLHETHCNMVGLKRIKRKYWLIIGKNHRLAFPSSASRHKYQHAMVRYGRQTSAHLSISSASGKCESVYNSWNPFWIPKSPTGSTSERLSVNIKNMSALHLPIPFTTIKCSRISSSFIRGKILG